MSKAQDNKTELLLEELLQEVKKLENELQSTQTELQKYTGLVGWSFQGEYNTTRKYNFNNVVYFRGGAYILRAETNVGDPVEDRGWQRLAGNDATYHPVKTVNNIGADEYGNIDLGQITSYQDLQYLEIELVKHINNEIAQIQENQECLTEDYLDAELREMKRILEDRINEIEKPEEPEEEDDDGEIIRFEHTENAITDGTVRVIRE